MALIECYECGKEISSMATSCPHCGAPARIVNIENEDEIDIKGDIYKDVIIDGKKMKKWFCLKSITDFSSDGKPIHKIEKTFFSEIDRSKINGTLGTNTYELKKVIRELTSDKEYWYEYNDKGNLIFEKNSDGEIWDYKYEYDSQGDIASRTERKTTLVDGDTITKNYKYDNAGRLLAEITDTGIFSSEKTLYEYDNKGYIISKDINGIKWHYKNDEKGNPIYAKRNSYNIEEWWAFYLYEYWSNGNIKKQIQFRTL